MRAFSRNGLCLFLIGSVVLSQLAFANLVSAQSKTRSQSKKSAESEFHRGYYLQHESNDFAEAIKAYKSALKLGANERIRVAVDSEMAELQEELATADFARIMPADAIAYLEISNPADHVERIAKAMGLTGKSFSPGEEKVTIKIDGELAISSDFQISPALLREFKKIRGAAIAITDLRENDPPFEGVAVLHPGDSDLIGGFLETGVQLVTATENIGGFPTFNVEGQVWLVKTERLVLASTSKSKIQKCLDRIKDQSVKSLADVDGFKTARSGNADAAVFAFVNPEKAVSKFERFMRDEIAIARMAFDLDSMEHVTAAVTATDRGLKTRFHVKYSEDHNSFGYGLIRTVPLSKKALTHVPSGAAGVVGMGLNPKMILAAQAAQGTSRHLSALDIGREFFANIEEVAVFVLPSVTRENDEIPNVGLVIASSDVEKSDSLWNQILTLPSMLKIKDGPTAKNISIDGSSAREYSFPDPSAPKLVIARIGDEALVAGTHAAVQAVIKARKSGETLANDDRAKAFWESNSEHTSKTAYVNVGRALRLAASLEGGRAASEMRMVSEVIQDLVVTLVVNEAPADFEVETNLVGLPQFDAIIKAAAKFQPAQTRRAMTSKEVQPSVSDRDIRADRRVRKSNSVRKDDLIEASRED
jgi:hypothetical protein